ncbi:FAD binding domain-containing protein [Armillaria luteobubalina]|uniref:FAD binding domain-containing protein n=1 Tax=Armillaria luteobubalina TaxID=153913 RepID=A0AA39Q6M1_9AGAR|nr:FAD binding domain-containing protein [Armillaria luteobubalina]
MVITSADFVFSFCIICFINADGQPQLTHFLSAFCHSMPVDPQVLVVGAGPSGLVLALSLIQNGLSVRIIDRNPEIRTGQRGAGIMPRSMELFELLGLSKPILDIGFVTPPVKTYDLHKGLECSGTFEIAPYMEPTAAFPYLNILCLGQDHLETILRRELEEKYHCPVELGTELLSFSQEENRVNASLRTLDGTQQDLTFSWLLGADGARGVVRKMLGLSFLGETSNIDKIVVGDIFIEGLEQEFWHMWGDAGSTLISLRPTETPSLFNFILTGKNIDNASMSHNLDGLRETFIRCTGAGNSVKWGKIAWVSNYRPNIRMVDNFGEGRVFLAGDSAHVHSFTGGQGMNTGIQDSFNLAWKLALVQRGLASPSLLRTYTEERLPVIAEMLNQTTVLLKQTFIKKEKPSVWRRGGSLLQLGVNYRWSSVVVDEQSDDEDDYSDDEDEFPDSYGEDLGAQLRAGDRAPDAPGMLNLALEEDKPASSKRLFELFGASHHTILVFVRDLHRCSSILKGIASSCPKGLIRTVQIIRADIGRHVECGPFCADYTVEDTRGHAYDAYSLTEGCCAVVVRPDGFIGAIVQDNNGLRQYFRGIFGSN